MDNLEIEKENRKMSTDDPKRFIGDFLESDHFRKAYNLFYSGKRLSPDVSEEEKVQVFCESDSAKVALIKFADEEERFVYNQDKFTPPVKMAARTYIKSVEDFLKMYREGDLSREDIKAMDALRYSYHQALAEILFKENFVPSVKLGRGLARLILISERLDTFDNASVRDGDRLSYLIDY